MKNDKCFDFDEISYSAQMEGGEFNSDNSYLWFLTPVKFIWHLSILAPGIF